MNRYRRKDQYERRVRRTGHSAERDVAVTVHLMLEIYTNNACFQIPFMSCYFFIFLFLARH
jgi:hypothetical protein